MRKILVFKMIPLEGLFEGLHGEKAGGNGSR